MKKLLIIIFVLFSTIKLFAQDKGTCTAPYATLTAYADFATADATANYQNQMTSWSPDATGTINTFAKINSGPSGKIGIDLSHNVGAGAADPNCVGNAQREVKLFLASDGACNWASGIPLSAADVNASATVTWSNPEFYNLTPNTDYIVQVRTIIPTTGGCAVQNQYLTYYQIIDPVNCTTCAAPSCDVKDITATDVVTARANISPVLNALTSSLYSNSTLIPGGASITVCVPVTVPTGSTVLGFKQNTRATAGCVVAANLTISYQLTLASSCSTPIAPNSTNADNVGSGFNPEWNNLAPGNYVLCYTMAAKTSMSCTSIDFFSLGYYNVIPPCTQPVISSQPSAQTKCNGEAASFSVTATGGNGYQWQVSTDNGATWTNVTGAIYSGATTSTLAISAVISSMNTYKYRCVISESVGSCPNTSNAALLTVNSGVAPTYTINKTDATCGQSNGSISITGLSAGATLNWTSGPAGATTQASLASVPVGTYTVNITSPSTAGGTTTSTLFTEDWETGGTAWTIDNTGGSNIFVINNAYLGGTCVSGAGNFTVPDVPNQSAAITTAVQSNYLHIKATTTTGATCTAASTNFIPLCANFDAQTSDQKVTMNGVVNTTGYTNIIISFYWLAKGDASGNDYGAIEYSTNNGTTWTQAGAKLNLSGTNWQTSTRTVAAWANIPNLKFRIRWINNATSTPDPPLAIDHIVVTGDQTAPASCGNTVQETITIATTNAPLAPTTTPVNYCIGDAATALTASGTNLLWYNVATGGTAIPTPTPSTTAAGVTTYYVSQSVSGCEGPRAPLAVTVTACCVLPTATAVADFTISCSSFPTGKTIGDPNATTTNVTYKWTPATGLDNDAIANPLANPTTTTVYTLVATASTGTDCTAAASVTVTINKTIPAVNAGSDITINCLSPLSGVQIGATAVSGVTCSWSPTTGLDNATLSNPTANPSTTTPYILTTTNTANGCTASAPITVTVDKTPPVAEAGGDLSICNGASINLAGSGGTTYLWSPATNLNNATLSNPSANPSTTTIYTLTAINGSCSGTDNMTLTVFSLPNASAGSDKSICAGGSAQLQASGGTSYAWDNSISGLDSYTSSNPTASPTSTSTYKVSVSENSCFSTAQVTVNVYAIPTASLGLDFEICQGESKTITATGGTSFSWNVGGTSSSITVSPAVSSTYIVTVSLNGCTASDEVTVNVKSAPVINFDADIFSGCAPLIVNFLDNSNPTPDTYLWEFGDGGSSSTPNPIHEFTDAGVYDIKLTAYNNGCQSTLTKNDWITVYPVPEIDFSWNPFVGDEYNNKIDFSSYSSTTISTYTWDFGDPFSNDNSSNMALPSHRFTAPDNYSVWLYAESPSGCRDSVMHNILIKDVTAIYIPNSFTPNGEGLNEMFGPVTYNLEFDTYNFYIYNRWGDLIFETNNPETYWDGIPKNGNTICQEGVYTWKMVYKEKEGKSYNRIGTVTLIK
ncbi:MAG: PKD domain-containing protein [Bacteroidota bacterium]